MSITAESEPDGVTEARELALKILDRVALSSAELQRRLVDKGTPTAAADFVVRRFVEVGILDDGDLAKAIVRTRFVERGRARRAIAQELYRKGFSSEDAAAALAQVNNAQEEERAMQLAVGRIERLKQLPLLKQRQRLASFLMRKGYPPNLAYKIVAELVSEH